MYMITWAESYYSNPYGTICGHTTDVRHDKKFENAADAIVFYNKAKTISEITNIRFYKEISFKEIKEDL